MDTPVVGDVNFGPGLSATSEGLRFSYEPIVTSSQIAENIDRKLDKILAALELLNANRTRD